MNHTLTRTAISLSTLLALLAFTGSAFADAPTRMPVQGYLADSDGVPVDGQVAIAATLYDDSDVVLHAETQNVTVDAGAFTMYLGTQEPLALEDFRDNEIIFLGIAVDGGQELSPRFELSTAPFAAYAQYAGDATTLGGFSASDFALADQIDFSTLENIPTGVADGDDDTLGGLACTPDQIAEWNGTNWVCGDKFNPNTLATVASTGAFSDLQNIPAGLSDGDDDTLAGLNCNVGQVAKWNGNGWSCQNDVDTDTNTTYDGGDFALSGNGCPNGYAIEDINGNGTPNCVRIEYKQVEPYNCSWAAGAGYQTSYDAYFLYSCPGDKVLRAIQSTHDNGREDRIFDFLCCDMRVKPW